VRVAAIVNRGAGAVQRQELTADQLRDAFAAAGVEAEVHFVDGAEIPETARAALARGVDALIAGGGDGTVRSLAAVLAGRREALGVLPLGTLNHFAKDLKVPLAVEEAVPALAAGRVHALDLGEVNGEVFVNNSSIGLYPTVVVVRDRQRERLGRGKWPATASALLKVVPRLPPLDVRLKVEGRAISRHTHFAFIGNNEYEMSLFDYGARSRLDSGDLYLYVARCSSRWCIVWITLLALFRDVSATRHFESWCLPEFTIETRRKVLPVYLDGEVVSLEPPLRYRNRPRALRVLVPAAATTE
jgi:diacylglycerol kinase family enzyme